MCVRSGARPISEPSMLTSQVAKWTSHPAAEDEEGQIPHGSTSPCSPRLSFPHTRSRDRSLLPGRAEHGQPTHVAASPPALLPPRPEQLHWFTKHSRRGLFLELISFRLLHLAIPSHLSFITSRAWEGVDFLRTGGATHDCCKLWNFICFLCHGIPQH